MQWTRMTLALALGVAVHVTQNAGADDCTRACALEKRTCTAVARDAFKQCRSVCRTDPAAGPECRRACVDAYRFARLLCLQDAASCREPCKAAERSCAGTCGAAAKECFSQMRATAKACRADCRQVARERRAQCKIDYPADPGPCLEAVGDEQSACLDGCGAEQEAGFQSCRATFDQCVEGCPPGEQPPKECHDLSGGLVVEVERSTKEIGYATVSWNSSFEHLGHVCADPITLTEADLEIAVDPPGATQFVEYVDNKQHPFTPLSPDPATGTIDPGTSVTVTFTGLHYDEVCDVYIGNSHFKALILVDKDLNGTLESQGYLGVNIHAEAEADCGP